MTADDFQSRLSERVVAAGLAIDASALPAIEAYFNLLRHWNKRINLTSLPLDPFDQRSLDRLFVEPLAAATYVPTCDLDWMDVGSGGGSPAIPIKIARPAAKLTLVESRSRKAAFLREVVCELELVGVEVVNDRFERIAAQAERRASLDLITIRAVKIDDEVADAALQILRIHGRVLQFSKTGGPDVSGIRGLIPSIRAPLAVISDSELIIFERT